MPGYPILEGETRVHADALTAQVTGIFERCGMTHPDAAFLAQSLVTADVRGVHSHGVLRVPEYVEKLTNKGVDPRGRPTVARSRGAALVVDGGNAMGQIACKFAMERAIERAHELGLAAAAIRGSNHCGALFPFAMMALPHDMIGLMTTNALPTMAPWGGRDKILGINPLAVAIPSSKEPPIVFDAAFSGSSHGKIRVYQQKGIPIPSNWAFDSEGQPTTDPAAAIAGLLQPIGEHKGVALAIVAGVLSSMLSGAAFGTELGNMIDGPRSGMDGQFALVLDVSAFEDPQLFKTRVDGLVRQIRESRPGAGYDRCYAPGELEYLTEQRYRAEGIPLTAQTIAGLNACVKPTA
jgi:LDH2 family malate/lactate/ureidoglycolate dehydrogenase